MNFNRKMKWQLKLNETSGPEVDKRFNRTAPTPQQQFVYMSSADHG